jgi:hypothetical protein
MHPPTNGTEATERSLTQRAVAIPALGWRLRVELRGVLFLRSNHQATDTMDLTGQSPLPGGTQAPGTAAPHTFTAFPLAPARSRSFPTPVAAPLYR